MQLHQTKHFHQANEIINKMKRQPPELEKIFTNDKRLISEIYKEFI